MENEKSLKVEGWFDGACGPENPGGTATWGALYKFRGERQWDRWDVIGSGAAMSNNVAEYAGLEALLKKFLEFVGPHHEAVIYGDSDLVVKQITGRWKAKRGLYLPWYFRTRELWRELKLQAPNVRLLWIPREDNTEADALTQRALGYAANMKAKEPEPVFKPVVIRRRGKQTVRWTEGHMEVVYEDVG